MRSEPAPKKSEWTIGPDPDTDAPPEDDELQYEPVRCWTPPGTVTRPPPPLALRPRNPRPLTTTTAADKSKRKGGVREWFVGCLGWCARR